MKKIISLVLVVLTLFSVMAISAVAADKITLCSNNAHDWYVYNRISPTCKDPGAINYKCTKCELGYKHETIDKLPHKDNDHNGICEVCKGDTTLGCDCLCHKVKPGRESILSPLASLVQFFRSLFKINHYCECGYHEIHK